jgi:uncharacterized membrane protein
MTGYVILKAIHICAVVIFMGNITTGLFWMRYAKKSMNFQLISFTMQGIIKSDRIFTIPGVLTIIAGGVGTAILGGLPMLRTGWVFWSIVLFAISGIVFMSKVAPLQRSIHKITNTYSNDQNRDSLWKEFQNKYQSWEFWGAIALITPLIALFLMIIKKPAITVFFQ